MVALTRDRRTMIDRLEVRRRAGTIVDQIIEEVLLLELDDRTLIARGMTGIEKKVDLVMAIIEIEEGMRGVMEGTTTVVEEGIVMRDMTRMSAGDILGIAGVGAERGVGIGMAEGDMELVPLSNPDL